MKKLRKAFISSVMFTTIFALSGIAAVNPAQAAASAGDLIKMEGLDTVYYLGADGKRYVFPNAQTYFSWYSDFSSVVTVPQSELESYRLGSNVTLRAGTKLIKITTDPMVYAVEPGGNLRSIVSEANAITLYGANWASRVIDVPDAFFTNYEVQADLEAGKYPAGQLVMSGENTYYYDGTDYRMVASDAAMAANRFQAGDVVVTTMAVTAGGSAVAGAEATLIDTSASGATTGITPGAGTGVSVGLDSMTPASANYPKNVDNIVFAKINLTAASDGDVTVNTLKVHRYGLGSDSAFDAITLYDGTTKLGSTRSSFNSDHKAVFNLGGNGWTIPAGQTKTLTIKAKVNSTDGANALGIQMASDIVTNGAAVSGTFPVYGNSMQAVTVSDMGAITATGVSTSNQTKKIGESDVQLAYFSLEESTGNEDLQVSQIILKNIGTAKDEAITGVYLKQGTEVLAGPVAMVNDYVSFDLSANPLSIEKSDTVNLKVVGNVSDGDGTTVEFNLKNDSDITVVGSVYGFSVPVTRTAFDTAGESITTTVDGSELNISLDSANVDTPDEVKNFEFGRFTISSEQMVKITDMTFTIVETDGDADTDVPVIDELELVDANDGSIYSLTEAGAATDTSVDVESWSFTDEEVLVGPDNSVTLIVRGDIPTGVGNGDQYNIAMSVIVANLTAETDPEGDAIDNFSVSSLTGKKVTVKSGALTVKSTVLNTEDIVSGAQGVVLFKGRLEAGSASDITVEQMKFEGDSGTATNIDPDNFSRAMFVVNPGSGESEEQAISTVTSGELDFNELNINVPAGTSNGVDFEVRMHVSDTIDATNTTVNIQLETVLAKDNDSDAVSAINESGTAIANAAELTTTRSVALKDTGVLYASVNITDNGYNKDRLVLAGSSAWVGKIKLRAVYEDIKVQDLKLVNANTTSEESVQEVCLYEETTDTEDLACQTLGTDGKVFFDDLDYVVEEGTKYLYIKVTTTNVGDAVTATADSQDSFAFSIQDTAGDITAEGVNSGDSLTIGDQDGTVEEGEIVFDDVVGGTYGTFDEATDDETGDTKVFTVTATQITAVSLESTAGGKSLATNINGTGTYNVAIIGVTTNATDNTDSEGVELKTALEYMKIACTKNTNMTFSGMTIERIGGTQGSTALTDDACDAVGETGDVTIADLSATGALSTDAYIDAGDTAYFLVKATVLALDGSAVDTVTLSLDDLDNGTTASVEYNDGSNTFASLNLDYTEVDGVKIDEIN